MMKSTWRKLKKETFREIRTGKKLGPIFLPAEILFPNLPTNKWNCTWLFLALDSSNKGYSKETVFLRWSTMANYIIRYSFINFVSYRYLMEQLEDYHSPIQSKNDNVQTRWVPTKNVPKITHTKKKLKKKKEKSCSFFIVTYIKHSVKN